MSRKRRIFSASFKVKVALAAARRDQTTAQLAAKFAVHSSQVTAWKKQLLEGVAELFVDGRSRPDDGRAAEEELYEQIGRLKMQVEWLKKNLPTSAEELRRWIEPEHPVLSVSQQCELLGLPRITWYYQPQGSRVRI